jgi:hypothetical protein
MSKKILEEKVSRLEKQVATGPVAKLPIQQAIEKQQQHFNTLDASTLTAFISSLQFIMGEPPSESYKDQALTEPLDETLKRLEHEQPNILKALIGIFTNPQHQQLRSYLNYKYATPQQKQRLNQLRKAVLEFQGKNSLA